MESIYTKLVRYGSKNECAWTNTVFLPTSEVCVVMVSLIYIPDFMNITSTTGRVSVKNFSFWVNFHGVAIFGSTL